MSNNENYVLGKVNKQCITSSPRCQSLITPFQMSLLLLIKKYQKHLVVKE